MKKLSLSIIGVMACFLVPTTFAEYTLTTADIAAIQTVAQKVQAKPVHVQEAMIQALKKKGPTLKDAKKQALYAALESTLRQKTASGDVLATSLERKEIVRAIFTQSEKKDTGSATIEFSGNMHSQQEGTLKFDGSISADVNIKDAQNPKIKLALDVTASNDDASVDVAGEMRMLNQMGYMMLKKFSFSPDEEQFVEMVQPYLNIWWQFPVESDMDLDTSTASVMQDTKQFQKLLTQHNIIPKLLYKGQKNGISSYSGTVDNATFVELAAQAEALQGNTVTEEEKAEMRMLLRGVSLQTNFSLDTQGQISGIVLTATLKNKKIADDTLSGTATVTIKTSSTVGPITAPSNPHDMSEMFITDGF